MNINFHRVVHVTIEDEYSPLNRDCHEYYLKRIVAIDDKGATLTLDLYSQTNLQEPKK